MCVTREKRLSQQYLSYGEQGGHTMREAIQIRGANFQLMRMAFDDSGEKVESFCQALASLRWPENANSLFAMHGISNGSAAETVANAVKPGKKSFPRGAGKVFKAISRGAGFRKEKHGKESKFAQIHGSQTLPSPSRRPPAIPEESDSDAESEFVQGDSDSVSVPRSPSATLTKTLDRLAERSDCVDYQRLNLCSKTELSMHSGGGTRGRNGLIFLKAIKPLVVLLLVAPLYY